MYLFLLLLCLNMFAVGVIFLVAAVIILVAVVVILGAAVIILVVAVIFLVAAFAVPKYSSCCYNSCYCCCRYYCCYCCCCCYSCCCCCYCCYCWLRATIFLSKLLQALAGTSTSLKIELLGPIF